MTVSKSDVFAEIERNSQYLIEVSKFIHSHPETNFEEHESSKYLTEQLKKLGYAAHVSVAGVETAFEATLDAPAPGPTVCIMAEYDALSITIDEKTTIVGHACGHNLNSAAAVGAAIGVKKALPQLHGRIMILGTPAEEGGGGKIALLEGDAFENVDAVLTMHGDQRDWYTVARSCTCSKFFNVTFTGKRATTKGTTIDSANPLDTLALFLSSLNVLDYHLTADTLIQRRLAPTGTTALNVMPLTSSLDIQVRSGDEDYLEKVITRVKDAAKGAALATGATVSISERQRNYQRIIQNKTLEEIAKKNVEETGHKFTYDQPSPYPFGTDSGNVSHVVPVAQFLIGRPEGLKFHTTEAIEQSLEDSAHRLMIEGAKILAGTAIDLLAEPRFVEQAKTEFIEYRANNFKGTISWHTE